MDARDSSSSSSSAAGPGTARDEEDGHLSAAAALAKDAALLFQSRRYTECLDVLHQLLEKKEDDPKVHHNIAVAEYYRDGCLDPKKLLEVLNKVRKREDAACSSGEQADVAGNLGSAVNSGSKGSASSGNQFSLGNATAYTDEFDATVARLNTAVVLFHLHEYENAFSVLEPLYQNIEPIDETTAVHICLLLLDVALASNNASRAADVIQYLEKTFGVGYGYCFGQGENGNAAQHQSSNQGAKVLTTQSTLVAPEASNSDSVSGSNASENPLTRTLSDEADYENLLSTLDIGGQNLSRPAPLSSQNDISRMSAERPAPAVDLKLKLHLYKVRLLLLTRNLKATKREVKLAMNMARGRDSSTALLLKSQLEYARGNHRKAVKLLMTSSNRTESSMPSIFNNNLGCIYHQLRKYNTAIVFFSKALKSSSSLQSEKLLKLSTFSQDKSLLIVYNCGLQYLSCGKPVTASRCFHKAAAVFYNRPLLWLRLAECCLLAMEKGILKSSGNFLNGDVRVHVVGEGKWRQVVVDDPASRNGHLGSVEEDGSLSSDDRNKLSIRYARQCLLNALHLLNDVELKSLKDAAAVADMEEEDSGQSSQNSSNHNHAQAGDSRALPNATTAAQASANGESKDTKGSVSANSPLQSSVAAYEELCRKEHHTMKQAVLADLAYVELSLENPLKALSAANELLQLPDSSRIYIFLGHVYAAEALCRLNRPKEAAEQLSAYLSDGNNMELPYNDDDRDKWRIEKASGDGEELNGSAAINKSSFKEETQGVVFLTPEEARGALCVNFAAMLAMQGDLEQAHRFATRALSAIPSNPKAVLAAVYVDLLLGKTQEALLKLRGCSHVRFFPSRALSNGS